MGYSEGNEVITRNIETTTGYLGYLESIAEENTCTVRGYFDEGGKMNVAIKGEKDKIEYITYLYKQRKEINDKMGAV